MENDLFNIEFNVSMQYWAICYAVFYSMIWRMTQATVKFVANREEHNNS